MQNLTNDAKKSLAKLYNEYRKRLKKGEPKESASTFTPSSHEDLLNDIHDDRRELKSAGMIRMDIIGNVYITADAIIMFENMRQEDFEKWTGLARDVILQCLPEILSLFVR